jgi:hypothetical protein
MAVAAIAAFWWIKRAASARAGLGRSGCGDAATLSNSRIAFVH